MPGLIKKSQRPVIYAGGGILSSHAADELLQLAEMISAPVTNTFMGLASFPGDHPLFLGMLGLHGTRYANLAVTECDMLLALGARFDDRVTMHLKSFAPEATVVHIDIDPAEIGKNVITHVPLVGDVKLILKTLVQQLEKIDRSPWLARIREMKEQYPLSYNRKGGLKPQFVIEQLSRFTEGNAIIATDVGQHQMWVAQYYRFKKPRTLISSGGLGAMGFGLPAAIGASIGRPGQMVVLVTGDGSIQMTMQELGTMMEQELPVKILILNNQSLGMVRQLQEFYCEGRYIAIQLQVSSRLYALGKGLWDSRLHARDRRRRHEAPAAGVVSAGTGPGELPDARATRMLCPWCWPGKGIDEAIDY